MGLRLIEAAVAAGLVVALTGCEASSSLCAATTQGANSVVSLDSATAPANCPLFAADRVPTSD
jgi:hypothetical protein